MHNHLPRNGALFLSMMILLMILSPVMATETEQFQITLKQTEHGTISCKQKVAKESDLLEVTASPDEGYRAVWVQIQNDFYGLCWPEEDQQYRLFMPGHDCVITALFLQEDERGIGVLKNMDGGEVHLSKTSGNPGDEVEMIIKPKDGYRLHHIVYWLVQKDMSFIDAPVPNEPECITLGDNDVVIHAYFEENLRNYRDIDKDAWYYDDVYLLTNDEIMTGVSEDQFAPSAKVTRAQIYQMLYACAGKPEYDSENPFSDVEEGKWYTNAVLWAVGEGLVSGFPDGTFRPSEPVTREQTAMILMRYDKFRKSGYGRHENQPEEDSSSDVKENYYASEAVHWMMENGAFTGTDRGIDPKGTVSRGQMAGILAILWGSTLGGVDRY